MMNLGVSQDVTMASLTSGPRAHAWMLRALIAVAVTASFMSAITVSATLVGDDAGTTPKLYHVALLVAGAVVVVRGRVVRPRPELLLYFGVTLGTSLIAYTAFEPRVAVVKSAVALYVAVVAAGIGRMVGMDATVRACRLASIVFLVAVVVKNAQHVPAFLAFVASPAGHPDVPSLAGGGLNLEATWLALASAFVTGTVLFVPFVLVAAATSALYASRAGVAIAAIVVVAALLATLHRARAPGISSRRANRSRRAPFAWALALAAAAGTATAVAKAEEYGDVGYVARRFATIGEEPGSMGRLTLWRGGLHVFAEHPLGVGMGNAVPELRRALGVDVPEDNLHNVYLQHAVETGLPGLMTLIVLAAMIVRRAVASRFRDHLLLFLCGYLVAGAIQFTGVDAVFWLVYGLQAGASGARHG